MPTVDASGTTSALVIGTETNVESAYVPSSAQTVQYIVDLGALASGEVCFVRVYTINLASGTERLTFFGSYIAGTDADPMVMCPALCIDQSIRCTVHQKNGTGRTVPWKRVHY